MAVNAHPCTILLFLLLTLIVTKASPAPELCGAANFDVRNLTSKLWRFTVPDKSFCLIPSAERCEVTMGFCRSVNMSVPCAQSAVCESYGSINETFNLASYEAYSNPFITTPLISGFGFTTHYPNGEVFVKPDNTTCTLATRMIFYCNKNATWHTDREADVMTVPGTPKVQLVMGEKLCTYDLTFDFAGACPVVIPSKPAGQLSPGSILLVIFFMSVILYFVLGTFMNVMLGSSDQGILLPHHKFWTSLPGYIKDGVQFTVTCGRLPSGRQTYESI